MSLMGQTTPLVTGYADRAVDQIRGWSALRMCRADSGGRAFALGRRQIMHLHCPDEAEVLLTWPVARRLGAVLLESGRARFDLDGEWVRIGLDSDSDVALLVSLLSVAIKANTPVSGGFRNRGVPCPYGKLASGRVRA